MGVFSRKWAKTALPISALIYTANGLLGTYFHARGVARKPGGWDLASYNVPMGPPIAAPGLMTLVGEWVCWLPSCAEKPTRGARSRRAGPFAEPAR
jgi:hypothetical protein